MLRYGERHPYRTFPTLGEGGTPLVSLPILAERLQVQGLWVKNEGQNPTGSHKDRLSPLVVARALELGRTTVVAASSGNQGVSLALYAAAAGLECEIVTTHNMYNTGRGFGRPTRRGGYPRCREWWPLSHFLGSVWVLAGSDYRDPHPWETKLVSIGGSTVTCQSVKSIRESGGCAVCFRRESG